MSALLVASTGGHLTELHRLLPRLGLDSGEVTWVTFDTGQSRTLLDGQDVRHTAYIAPRDVRRVVGNLRDAGRIIGERPWDPVVSTGSGIALSFLPLARLRGLPCHYIESAARSEGPSTTGRLLSAVPGMRLYTQNAAWASDRWRFRGSVFDDFATAPETGARPIRRVLVTLGTIPYGFRRLVDRLLALLPRDAEVVWQTGATPAADLPQAHHSMPPTELDATQREVELVVAHAGIGSALGALEAGRCPILVPREQAHGEHVDDHQALIADELDRRGLAIGRRVEQLTLGDLERAARTQVQLVPRLRPFVLEAV